MQQTLRQSAATDRRGPAPAPAGGPKAMFFRRWLANPLRMGSVVPASAAVCNRIVRR